MHEINACQEPLKACDVATLQSVDTNLLDDIRISNDANQNYGYF